MKRARLGAWAFFAPPVLVVLFFMFAALNSQAAVIFAVRGESLTPRYARGGKAYAEYQAPVNFGTPVATVASSSISCVGCYGSSVINVSLLNGDSHSLRYTAGGNWPTGTDMSIRLRIVPTWSGNPATDKPIFYAGSAVNDAPGGLVVYILDNGKLWFRLGSASHTLTFYVTSTSNSALSFTAYAATEIMISCGSLSCSASQDGVNVPLTNNTWSSAYANRFNGVLAGSMTLGPYSSSYYLDELIIWDSKETAVYTPSGSYEAVADVDVTQSSDPGIANVKSGTAYVISGVSLTGTAAIAAADDVKIGVSTGSTVGTYDGSDRWTCPLAAQLSTGVELQCNSLTANLTGTRDTVTNLMRAGTMSGQSTRGTLRAR